MKYVKYLIFSMCVGIAVFLTNELVKMQNADYSCFPRMEIQDLAPDHAERRIRKLEDLMRKNQLSYFFVTENRSEAGNMEIDVYFPSKDTAEVCMRKWGRKAGQFNSMISGKTKVTFHETVMELAGKKTMPAKVYQCVLTDEKEIGSLPYQASYLSEQVMFPGRVLPYRRWIGAIWAVIAFSLLLLSVLEVFFSRKEIFIKLSYGYDYRALLRELLCRETAGVLLSTAVPYGLLFHFVSCAVLDKNMWIGIFLLLGPDLLILASPFYFLNFKLALGKGETNTGVLSFCYILRILMIVLSIGVLSAAIQRVKNFRTCLQYDKVMMPYRGYLCVRDSQAGSAAWEERFVLEEIMRVSVGEDKMYPVVVANENAKQSLYGILSEEALQRADGICVFLPDELERDTIAQADQKFFLSCVTDDPESDRIRFEHYPGGKILSYLGVGIASDQSVSINDELEIQMCMSPIIVYVPAGHSSIYTNTVVFLKGDDAGLYRNAFDLYSSYIASMMLYKMQTVVLLVIAMIVLLFHFLLRKIILRMEQSVNAMELCLKKIYGMGICERYQKTIRGSFFAHAIGLAFVGFWMKNALGEWLFIVAGITAGLFGVDVLLEITEIFRWEKKYTVSVLKGGIG